MYREAIMQFYADSTYRGRVCGPHMASRKENPSCGDMISFSAQIADNQIAQIKFEGSGCILSQAAAAWLCAHAQGKSPDALLKLTPDAILSFFSLELGPNRMQCIQLPLDTLQQAVTTTHNVR